MADDTYFDDDIVDVRLEVATRCSTTGAIGVPGCRRVIRTRSGGSRSRGPAGGTVEGFIRSGAPLRTTPLLWLSMVEVQQGDGLILRTPTGKVVFIDGGDNKLFARFVANAFPGSSDGSPLVVDAMLITRGDADHFAGLSALRHSERLKGDHARKRVLVAPKRVYHNGLVKRPTTDPATGKDRADKAMFGAKTSPNTCKPPAALRRSPSRSARPAGHNGDAAGFATSSDTRTPRTCLWPSPSKCPAVQCTSAPRKSLTPKKPRICSWPITSQATSPSPTACGRSKATVPTAPRSTSSTPNQPARPRAHVSSG